MNIIGTVNTKLVYFTANDSPKNILMAYEILLYKLILYYRAKEF